MELHEFITATLSDIQQGVQNAINSTIAKGVNGAINPAWGTTDNVGPELIRDIQFDVAVTVVEREGGSFEGGIQVVGLKIGGSASGGTESTFVSRIQFSIPIVPPVTAVSHKPTEI